MKISGDLQFIYKSEDDAKLVYESLEVDNENYLESELNDKSLDYQINIEKLGTFLATVDDLIASEIVVEKIIDKTKQ